MFINVCRLTSAARLFKPLIKVIGKDLLSRNGNHHTCVDRRGTKRKKESRLRLDSVLTA